MFGRLFGAQKWFALSVILLALVMSTAYAVTTVVQTFKDPAYTVQNSTFAQDETVYTKLTTNQSESPYFIEYWQLNPLNLLLKKGPLAVDVSSELKDSHLLDYYQEPGDYSVKFLNNPQYKLPFRAIIDSPASGILSANSPVTYSFYLIDRENQIIKKDLSTNLNVILQESASTLPPNGPMAGARLWSTVLDENPSFLAGWSFNSSTGIYSKTVIGFNPGSTVRFRVAGMGAEQLLKIDPIYKPEPTHLQGPIEQDDKFFMGAVPETLVYQTVTVAESYPYKIQIIELNQQVTANPLTIRFKLFDSTYQNQITDTTGIQFVIIAKEANDYGGDAKQTVVQGSMPIFADGAWQSQLSLPTYGKYRVEVKAKSVFWPKDSVVINYPVSADFKVVDIRPPTTSFSINPANPNGLNGWYQNSATISLTPDEKATTYFNWDSEPQAIYSQPISSQEGSHLLNYYSIDRFNNVELKKSQEIKIDTKNPIISEEAPRGLINDNKPSISAKLADESSGINQDSIELKLDNLTVGSSFDPATGKLTYIPLEPISEGTHQVNLAVSDLAGNKASSNYSFEVKTDQEAPVVRDTKPGGVIYSFKPMIEAILEDAGTGVNEASIDLKIDGSKVAATYDAATSKLAYTPSSNLAYGRHQVDLTVADKAGNIASASWRFTIIGTRVSGWINVNTTWEADASPYIVEGDVYVNSGVTLTVEPGTVIKFEQGKSLTSYGILLAQGTAQNKIAFTSIKDDSVIGDTNLDGSATSPAPGDWGYINLNPGLTNSQLDNVVVNYSTSLYPGNATIQNSTISNSSSSGIYISEARNPQILNNRIENNKGSGISVQGYSEIWLAEPTIVGNTITNNGSDGIYLYYSLPVLKNNNLISNKGYGINFGNYRLIDLATNTASGNRAGVRIGEGVETVSGEVNLPYSMSPYVSERTFAVDTPTTLNIEAGSVFKFSASGYYAGGLNIYGKLNALGTATNKITFTSLKDDSVAGDTNQDGSATSPSPGDWGYINLRPGLTVSQLDNVVVNYSTYLSAGNATIKNSTIANSALYGIYVESGQVPQILNNTIENTKGNGIYSFGLSETWLAQPTIVGNTIKNNTGDGINAYYTKSPRIEKNNFIGNSRYPIYLQNSVVEKVLQNTGSGNGYNWIYLSQTELDQSAIIDGKTSLPFYVFDSLSLKSGQTVDIFGGTVFKFGPSAYFNIYGTLNAQAPATDPIYFTSQKDDSIGGDTNNDGNATTPSRGDWNGIGFYYGSDASVLKNAEVKYGGGSGANVDVYSNATIDSVKINNAKTAMSVGSSGSPTIQNNTLDSNDTALRLNSAGGNITNNTITNSTTGIETFGSSFAYVAQNSIAGSTTGVRINSSSYANLYYNNINNNTTGIFTDLFTNPYIGGNTISGSDKGIYANSSPPLVVGNNLQFNQAAIYSMGASPSIKNNFIANNTKGFEAYFGGAPKIVANTVNSNNDGLYFASASPKIYNNTINSNNTGINAFSSGNLDIQKNSITYNNQGIRMNSSSTASAKMNNINNNSVGTETRDSSQILLTDNNIQGNGLGASAYESSIPIINYNNIYNNSFYNVANYKTPTGTPPTVPIINAENNWWNTTEAQAIANTLYTKDTIDYSPWLTAATPTDKSYLDDKRKLTVLTYNIEGEKNGTNSFVDEIQSASNSTIPNPSISGLQEVSLGRYNKFSPDNYAISGQEWSLPFIYYNATVLSPELNITLTANYQYSIDLSSDGQRALQRIEANLNGRPVTVFNTHLPTDEGDVDRAYRMLSGNGLSVPGVIDRVVSGGDKVIFTLDSNNHYYDYSHNVFVDPNSPEGKQYKELNRLEGEYNYKVDSHATPTRGTVNIDYIFYKGLTEENSTVLTYISGSDHWPVKVVFSYE